MIYEVAAASSPQHISTMPHKEIPHSSHDTEEVASFLLALKHNRSVTPEPPSDESNSLQSPQQLPVYNLAPALEQAYVDKTPALFEDPTSNIEAFLGDSELVVAKDRDLVPDALFVAMAQMRPCKLTQADRVGCYKTREVGFVGMCCMHCGGQPGFGRYYPNSVRSLAQTTTSQTILKHVGGKCRFCPPHIRNTVNELQRQQAAREGMSSGRPRYGSRKVFFQRVWARLHGGSIDDDDASAQVSKVTADDSSSNQTHSDMESQSRNSTPASSDDEGSQAPARKHGFGVLSKRSLPSSPAEHAAKRPRVLSN